MHKPLQPDTVYLVMISAPQSKVSMADPSSAGSTVCQQRSAQSLPEVYQPALQPPDKPADSAAPGEGMAGEKGELASYFGVSWTPDVSLRSPGGRVRRTVGCFTTANGTPVR